VRGRCVAENGVHKAAKPARSRHCNGEPFRERHWETGKARCGEDPEPGNLPVRARTVTFG